MNIFGVAGSHTAKDHTFEILKADTINGRKGNPCSNSHEFTPSSPGIAFIWLSVSDNSGNKSVEFCVGGMCRSQMATSIQDGIYLYDYVNVNAYEKVTTKVSAQSTLSDFSSCSIFVSWVYK